MSDTKKWLYGLFSGFIGGFAGAVDSSLALMIIAPENFNLGPGLRKTLLTALVLGLLTGGKTAFAYLKQSPLPRVEWTNEQRQAMAVLTPPPADPQIPEAPKAKP